MSKEERFTIEHFGEFDDIESFIYDNKCQRRILKSYNYGYNDLLEMLDFINQQDQEIQELKKQLENAIVPKFKIGQKVWYVSMTNYVCNFIIQELQYTLCYDGRSGICYFSKDNLEEYEWNLFATKEEAQAKLEELQGENK